MQADEVLNAGETHCGELIMLIFQRMKTLDTGKVLQVAAYDPGAAVDIAAWCRMTHNALLHVEPCGSITRFFIRKGES